MEFEKIEKIIEMARKHGIHKLAVAEGDFEVSITIDSSDKSNDFVLSGQVSILF